MQFFNIIKLINNKYYLSVDDFVLPCQVGKNGVVNHNKKIEGDFCTPSGVFRLNTLYYRVDRVEINTKKLQKNLEIRKITKNCGWCDDPNFPEYNTYIKIKEGKKYFKGSYENLWRDDEVYDLILDLGYNKNPIEKLKGSAIFLHCSFDDNRSTKGCLAVKKKNFEKLLNKLEEPASIIIDDKFDL